MEPLVSVFLMFDHQIVHSAISTFEIEMLFVGTKHLPMIGR